MGLVGRYSHDQSAYPPHILLHCFPLVGAVVMVAAGGVAAGVAEPGGE